MDWYEMSDAAVIAEFCFVSKMHYICNIIETK